MGKSALKKHKVQQEADPEDAIIAELGVFHLIV